MTVSRTLEVLEELLPLLERHDVKRWSKILSDMRANLKRALTSADNDGILASLRSLRGVYGGMGSFGDLVISERNGHDILPRDYVPVNTRLQALRSDLFDQVENGIDELEAGKNK